MEEFNEEIDGEVHHQHHLLSCLNLTTEGKYSIQNEDPAIYSDSEEDSIPRAWPDLALPKPSAAAEIMPPTIRQQLIKDMMLQHDTACKVLDRLGINACKEHQKSSAVTVLARVRRGNTLCSICGHSFNPTQSLRTHIQGQHMDASHLKYSKCDYSAGIVILSGFIQGSMTLKGRSLSVTLLVVEGSTIPKAISMNIRGSTHKEDHHHAQTVARTSLACMG